MINKIIRIFISIIGFIIGSSTYLSIAKEQPQFSLGEGPKNLIIAAVIGLILGIIIYMIIPWTMRALSKIVNLIEKEISRYPRTDILLGSIGLIFGFAIAYLVSGIIREIPMIGNLMVSLTYLFMGYLGVTITIKSRDDIFSLMRIGKLSQNIKDRNSSNTNSKKDNKTFAPKILDTSVIIDGRIADICKTGFIEGKLIIPKFVLDELQHIADSSDDLKRVRGRRGLDILNTIQKELEIEVEINEDKIPEIDEVDSKLLKLAQKLGGKVVTNDYNLNKVAQFRGVEVLNINELSNAIKPVAIPGEEMVVHVVKEGKEQSQGIAYLDDGTMIVVDGGKKHMNETIRVLVTSVLQTPAGRMIFAKPKN